MDIIGPDVALRRSVIEQYDDVGNGKFVVSLQIPPIAVTDSKLDNVG